MKTFSAGLNFTSFNLIFMLKHQRCQMWWSWWPWSCYFPPHTVLILGQKGLVMLILGVLGILMLIFCAFVLSFPWQKVRLCYFVRFLHVCERLRIQRCANVFVLNIWKFLIAAVPYIWVEIWCTRDQPSVSSTPVYGRTACDVLKFIRFVSFAYVYFHFVEFCILVFLYFVCTRPTFMPPVDLP